MDLISITFVFDDKKNFSNLQKAFNALKKAKELELDNAIDSIWDSYFQDTKRPFCYEDDEWDMNSMIDAILKAEYSLVSCELIGENKGIVYYEWSAYSLECLIVFIQAFYCKIISLPFDLDV